MSASIAKLIIQLREARGALSPATIDKIIKRLQGYDLPGVTAISRGSERKELHEATAHIGSALEGFSTAAECLRRVRISINDYIALHIDTAGLGQSKEFTASTSSKAANKNPLEHIINRSNECSQELKSDSLAQEALGRWKSRRFKVGKNTLLLSKKDMKHILTRHHPDYWVGKTRRIQSFLDKKLNLTDIEYIVEEVLRQNSNEISGKTSCYIYQVTGVVDEQEYILGVAGNHVKQLFPPATESIHHDQHQVLPALF